MTRHTDSSRQRRTVAPPRACGRVFSGDRLEGRRLPRVAKQDRLADAMTPDAAEPLDERSAVARLEAEEVRREIDPDFDGARPEHEEPSSRISSRAADE